METEKETSLHARSSLSPLALLGILAFAFILPVMSKRRKQSQSSNPQHDSRKPVQPQASPQQESAQRNRESTFVPNVPPPPTDTDNSKDGTDKKLTAWKIAKRTLQVLGFLVLLAYTFFAGGQWIAMNRGIQLTQRQLADSEAAQAARLVIKDIQVTRTDKDFFDVVAKFTVKNVGPTIADDIGMEFGNSSGNADSQPANVQPVPHPGPAGPSLGPGDTREYTEYSHGGNPHQVVMDQQMAQLMAQAGLPPGDLRNPAEPILSGKKRYMVTINVSYNDIFKRKPHITTDCVEYDPLTKSFVPCMNLMHHHE